VFLVWVKQVQGWSGGRSLILRTIGGRPVRVLANKAVQWIGGRSVLPFESFATADFSVS
jgi:hypothetical protein